MLETFMATLSPMLVMFLCMLIGFVMNKSGIAPKNTGTVLSRLETYVLVPALIINTFTEYCTVESIVGQYSMILYCLVGIALSVTIAFPLARCFEKNGYGKKLYQYAFLSANFGFLGNAIVPQILGQDALYPYMLFTLPMNLMCYGWWVNILIPEGEKKKSFWQNLLNPVCICLILGVGLGLSGAGTIMPGFVETTVDNLAGCMGPVAMILTGFIIGDYDILEILKNWKVYIASFLRLIVIPIVILAVLYLLKADKTVLVMALFGFGTPLGLNTVVFPAAYGGDTKTGASMAMISHVACIVTIPLMYAVLMTVL